MDSQEFIEKYSPFVKRNWHSLVLGLIGLMLFVYGVIYLLGSSSQKDITFEKGSGGSLESSTDSARIGSSEIVVDVEGAVVSPGVYHLSSNSRIKDLLIAASGLSSSADRNWVAKNLNLAAKLNDSSKVYIPFLGEKNQPQAAYSGSNVAQESSFININTANDKDLDSLPGVGPVTAQKIINGRPYGAVDELLSKRIITNKIFEEIKYRIAVY